MNTRGQQIRLVEALLFASAEPLTEDLTLACRILANLYVSTTATDSHWIVTPLDDYPGAPPTSATCCVPM